MNKTLKYVSLFSSAGVGCYGFKKSGFDCVATNEIIERRLDVQKINKKCSSETGYISGDITLQETKDLIMEEIRKNCGTKPCSLDLLVATPPCQGMSVANLKKTDEDINRNSLVVESVEMVKRIIPKFFVFENVPAFLNTCCIDNNNDLKTISEMITDELGKHYSIYSKTINFKNYGSMSSRTRTLVIGVHKKYSNYISPIELFPAYREEKTLREVIGDLPTLQWGEFYKNDFYHQFRTYSENMYEWIANTPEGESAFDNENPLHRPHQIIDGNMVPHVRKNSGKYTRMFWDKVAPCILTRNDQFASQRTIHPTENRVLSIRELMRLMTIPDDFKWCDYSLEELNQMTEIQKKELLKKNEINIRQSIGEAVPTEIFHQIGNNIKTFLSHKLFESKHFSKLSSIYDLENNIKEFIVHNPENYTVQSLSLILELSNANRLNTAAYYTDKSLLTEITKELPEFNKNTIRILEPSVGAGNFIPFLVNKYEDKELIIDVVDIDISILECTKELLEKYSFSDKVQINYIHTDFLLQDFDNSYDLLIGNPPFGKIGDSTLFQMYKQNVKNKETNNISSFFLEKAMDISNHVVMILPKAI